METIGDTTKLGKLDRSLKEIDRDLGIGMGVSGGIMVAGAIATAIEAPQVEVLDNMWGQFSYGGEPDDYDDGIYQDCIGTTDSGSQARRDCEDREAELLAEAIADYNEDKAAGEAELAQHAGGLVFGVSMLTAGGTAMGVVGFIHLLKTSSANNVRSHYDKPAAREAVQEYNYELAKELGFTDEEAQRLKLISRVNPRRPRLKAEPMFGFNFVGIRGRW